MATPARSGRCRTQRSRAANIQRRKPNRLAAIPMELHTRPDDLCYEPFSGSGSQLIAAEQLGRRCYAIELEPRFVDVGDLAMGEADRKEG